VLWFSSAGLFPLTLLGVTWTASMIPEILILDVALLLLFIHLGWNMRLPVASPSERTLLMIAGVIFLVVSLLHLMRLAFGWHFILGGVAIPQWISWAGFFIAGYFSYSCFHFARVRRH
jgi:hypothetical protein